MEESHLKKLITDWVKFDYEVRELQSEKKIRKDKQKLITSELISIMSHNKIDCVDISNGQISYNKKSIKKPITQKILINLLATYYINEPTHASDLSRYILENRDETTKESITITRNL
jgi:hypothetical protein